MNNPFRSFWMAGFECTDKLNCFGNRVDFLNITGHLDNLEEDYRNLSLIDIRTIREGIRWSQVEREPYHYNWSDVRKIIDYSMRAGIQVVWDICHFGFPDDLTPLHPMFARRFRHVCCEFIKFYRSIAPSETIILTPINEVGFLAWLGGEVCGTSPYCKGYGWEVKYALCKAYIEAIAAMKEMDGNICIMSTEPLVNNVPAIGATEAEIVHAALVHQAQFQALDIITGARCPELKGRPEYIDIVGCNYYHNNQWIVGTNECLPWANELGDPRWSSLSDMLAQLHQRYQKPIVLSETSHPGDHKSNWIKFISDQCNTALDNNVPLWGICWYPIIDRPDWDFLDPWHNAGIWDVDLQDGKLIRVLDHNVANSLREAQCSLLVH